MTPPANPALDAIARPRATQAIVAPPRMWSKPGVVGFFTTVDHKRIALRFLVTAFAFFTAGGVLSGLVRHQLSVPDNTFLGPDAYNQIFTMHGTTMMFLFAVPVMQGMALYLVPLMVGTRNIAFPRMNAYAYWIYLAGGVMVYVALFGNVGPDAGWFSYVPLAGPQYGVGKRSDFWAQMITFTEVSALLVATSIITTVFKLRAPGMTLDRVPLFVWAMLVTSFMILFAMPAVMLASTALIMDRLVGTHLFNPAEGGDPLLWQHLFWFFGHPEVYLIFMPALGMISPIVETFSRRPIFGYPAMVLSLIATGFFSFALWVHHMFATEIPELGKSFFTAASMVIAIPTAIQIFCWIATLWMGRLVFKTALLFIFGFFFILVIGGLTGIMVASVPLDLQLHDTQFVVAHLHYVLIGGAVFPLLGAIYYWFPKFTGKMMSERLGHWHFWLMFVGVNLTFFPMHELGLRGMPRRVYTYAAEQGFGPLNFAASVGDITVDIAMLLFLINLVWSLWRGARSGANPWNAGTLEWLAASPPSPSNFTAIPIVGGRAPLWEANGVAGRVEGLVDDPPEVLVTSVLEARPEHRAVFPSPSIWPLISVLATTALFVGSIFTPWAVVWFALPVALALTIWFWPTKAETEQHLALERKP